MMNLTFSGGEGGGQGDPHSWTLISIIIGKHVKMFCSKFQQNRTINEEFDFFWGRGGGGKGTPFINLNFNCYW